jgi:hypothetical protein
MILMCRIDNKDDDHFVIESARTRLPAKGPLKFFRKQRVDTACVPIQ